MKAFNISLFLLVIINKNCLSESSKEIVESQENGSKGADEMPSNRVKFMPGIPIDVLSELPSEAVEKIRAIQANSSLNSMEKANQIDAVFSEQSAEVLDKIPEPPNFAGLPEEVKKHIRGIFRQKEKKLEDKNEEFHEYVNSLPVDQQNIIKSSHPLPMPLRIREVLPEETLSRIDQIQANRSLMPEQKVDQIDALISALPDDILDKIPDPPQYSQLPLEVKQKLNSIKRQKDKSFSVKNQEFIKYVQTLPREQQALII